MTSLPHLGYAPCLDRTSYFTESNIFPPGGNNNWDYKAYVKGLYGNSIKIIFKDNSDKIRFKNSIESGANKIVYAGVEITPKFGTILSGDAAIRVGITYKIIQHLSELSKAGINFKDFKFERYPRDCMVYANKIPILTVYVHNGKPKILKNSSGLSRARLSGDEILVIVEQ